MIVGIDAKQMTQLVLHHRPAYPEYKGVAQSRQQGTKRRLKECGIKYLTQLLRAGLVNDGIVNGNLVAHVFCGKVVAASDYAHTKQKYMVRAEAVLAIASVYQVPANYIERLE